MITLKRIAFTKDGTFGVLMSDGVPFAVTLERPWLDNKRSVSCIPSGDYTVKRCRASEQYSYKDSPKFGNTFVIENVPGRSNILFHKGNLDDDTNGCVLVGEQFGSLNGDTAILSSKHGFYEFLAIHKDVDQFSLRITDPA